MADLGPEQMLFHGLFVTIWPFWGPQQERRNLVLEVKRYMYIINTHTHVERSFLKLSQVPSHIHPIESSNPSHIGIDTG